MVGRRGRPRLVAGDTASTPNPIQNNTNDDRSMEISDYEQSREERIQENLQRMQKLGIIDLSLQLKSLKPAPRPRKVFSHRKTPVDFAPVPPSGLTRRSSRLRNVASVSYTEVDVSKKDEKLESMVDFLRGEGSRPEVYTEEHEKLLGSTEMTWTLFVDGCGKDGKRIYDPVKGKTCHQCRQKTLGHRTHCSKCGMVQGQFCGDCLYMRYGEHVLEANQNPNWTCPVCRGICNCSLCRQSKGWPATGSLYRKISSLGYISVAHYLVQTRRAEPEEVIADVSTTSVIGSETLSHVEELTNSQNGETKLDNNLETTENPLSPELSFNEKVEILNCCIEPESSSKQLRKPSVNTTKVELENVSFLVNVDTTVDDTKEIGKEGQLPLDGNKGTLGFRQKKNSTIFSNPSKGEEDSKICSSFNPKEVVTSPEAKRKNNKIKEVSPDSIGGRLRQRRFKNIM